MKKCRKQYCTACLYTKEGKSIKTKENKTWEIKKNLNCGSYNIIYLIECEKESCIKRYVGETGRLLKFRIAEHRGYVNNRIESQATGSHFNLPGHSLANLKITILEQVKINSEEYRKERESYYIRQLNTFYKGMNKQK